MTSHTATGGDNPTLAYFINHIDTAILNVMNVYNFYKLLYVVYRCIHYFRVNCVSVRSAALERLTLDLRGNCTLNISVNRRGKKKRPNNKK